MEARAARQEGLKRTATSDSMVHSVEDSDTDNESADVAMSDIRS